MNRSVILKALLEFDVEEIDGITMYRAHVFSSILYVKEIDMFPKKI